MSDSRYGRATVRGAARARETLGGADAQALEHALTITERERDEARATAYVLVHSYDHDSRPPEEFVERARKWKPVRPSPKEGGR